jgi:hypothetical protein
MSEPACIDLRPWANEHRYRWRFEEGHSGAESDSEWYVEVICRYGLIYPKGGNVLLAYATSGVKRHISALRTQHSALIEHHQWDDSAEVFRFPSALLDDLAAILKPKRLPGRAEPTDKQREILKRHAFQGGQESLGSTQLQDKGKGEG